MVKNDLRELKVKKLKHKRDDSDEWTSVLKQANILSGPQGQGVSE
jgi:hypothetical protein